MEEKILIEKCDERVKRARDLLSEVEDGKKPFSEIREGYELAMSEIFDLRDQIKAIRKMKEADTFLADIMSAKEKEGLRKRENGELDKKQAEIDPHE
ncbi:MAG: hypothetical protein JRJ62_15680, partial [Deltaproteobacteria bacterium]|nr:hypothetical protein [Deltaproteobacteria bacterium]